MGTAKRERQKANRRQNLEKLAREARVRKSRKVGLRVGLLIVGVVVLVGGITIFGGGDDAEITSSTATTTLDSTVAPGSTIAYAKPTVAFPGVDITDLKVTELSPGTGAAAANGDSLVVHYVGVRSIDGVEFDNSYDRGSPFELVLGAGMVIQGWEQGLVGVQAGGQYQIDIPSNLGYGDTGSGDVIRPNDDITFVVDIVSITPAG